MWLGALCLCAAPAAPAQQGHTLIAHYTFAAPASYSAQDSSGNNNNINGGSSWTPDAVFGYSANGIAGGGALLLDGGENVSDNSPPPDQTFDNWLAAFYGSFSVSIWVNTTSVTGNDTDDPNGYTGASVIWAYNNGVNDTIPIALTGHKAAFFTGDPTGGNGDTLHSTNDVTTGTYVHIVVTRDQSSGRKTIYINGALDSSDTGTTNHLDGDTGYYAIGGVSGSSYTGLLDDVQLYSGVLNSNEVAFLYANPGAPAPNLAGPSSGLVAYYDFDENTDFAADLTANGNNLVYGGNFGGPVLSTNSISGSGAVYFNGGDFLTPTNNLLPTLAGNFSVSLWVNTTQTIAWDTAPAFYGAGIVSADVPGLANDLIPVALTGGAIGFNSGGTNDDTLNSATNINDGHFHHVVVTRDQTTGEKQIYIDGLFSTNDFATPGLLGAPQLITIGALADASNPDPASPIYSGHNGFVGLMDDIQVYSRVLASAEVAALFATPGSTAAGGLVAHYDFDEGAVLAADVSGNSNNMVFAGSLKYNAPGPGISPDAESGAGALSFDGSSYLVPENNLVTNLAGNFSLSVWLLTTQSSGVSGQPAYQGAGIVTALVPGQSSDLAPLALTGGNIAFETDGSSDDVLTSTRAVNDGIYHHLVVTRNQGTGRKQIYIDGALDNSDTADTALLNAPQIVIFGAQADASQTDPYSPSLDGSNGYVGLMDNVQIYSRPGATLPVPSTNVLRTALGASNLVWTTTGDAAWFVETTNTYSTNAAAAQSGSLLEDQSSLLQATVTGPGTLSFYWQTMANSDDFDLEFDVDGGYRDDIGGQTSWSPDSFPIQGSGGHTLTWNANTLADSGSSPTDAGFVDQVVFTPATAPVITLNPFDQTNYPGYSVALLAGATGVPAPAWQWYEVGNPNPISGATSALFIPADSGSSNAAGSYYAVATNLAGSQTTTTALVTFVSLPAPPDWSEAFKSPFVNYDDYGSYVANDVFHACLLDSTGANIFSTGYSSGANFFGTNEILNLNGQYAAVIVKQTTAKAGLWVVAVTNDGNGSSYGEALAPAPGGGVYAAVGFSGTNWLGVSLLEDSGVGSILLARLDANGNPLWTQTISSTNGAFPVLNCLVSDPSGNVTLAGVVNGSFTIAGGNVTVSGQTSFLAQFNQDGALNWVERVQNIIEYLQYSDGRVYASLLNWLSGDTNYTVGGLSNTMTRNYTLAALDASNGQGIWLTGVGEAVGANPTAGAIDDYPEIAVSGANLFLVGTAYGSSAVFGPFTVPIAEGRGQYFARYDTNGNAQLATGFGGATTQPYAAVADANGNVYVAGNFDTYTWFGNDILAAPRLAAIGNGYFSQAFAAKFDSAGTPLWARMAESTNLTVEVTDLVNFYDIALAPNGVWVCGEGSGAVYFGTNLVNSSGQYTVIGDDHIFTPFDSGMLGMIAETPASVTLLNPVVVGANFQFQFLSQAGFTHDILFQTNPAAAVWLTNSTVAGDGTVRTISIPLSVFSPSMDGFVRVSTH
ncbi:MAG: LamG-like jellyroll fold domain-containing protein [Verrucomicrobiota bacterium]